MSWSITRDPFWMLQSLLGWSFLKRCQVVTVRAAFYVIIWWRTGSYWLMTRVSTRLSIWQDLWVHRCHSDMEEMTFWKVGWVSRCNQWLKRYLWSRVRVDAVTPTCDNLVFYQILYYYVSTIAVVILHYLAALASCEIWNRVILFTFKALNGFAASYLKELMVPDYPARSQRCQRLTCSS